MNVIVCKPGSAEWRDWWVTPSRVEAVNSITLPESDSCKRTSCRVDLYRVVVDLHTLARADGDLPSVAFHAAAEQVVAIASKEVAADH